MGRPAGGWLRLLGGRAGRRRREPSLAAALWGPAAMTLEEIHGQEPVPAGHDWYVSGAAVEGSGAAGRVAAPR